MNITPRGDQMFQGTLGPGTTVVVAAPATLKRIIWGGTFVGSAVVHNASAAAGTNGTSDIVSIGIPALRFPFSLEVNLHCTNGIVVEESGTPALTYIWSKE